MSASLNPISIAPKEAGIKRQKEKLKAVSGDRPMARPVAMVVPARERPGRMAKAWEKPIIIACFIDISDFSPFDFFVENKIRELTRKNIGKSQMLEKIESTVSFKKTPTRAAGIEAKII
jgi:hypothetical protein